MDEAERKRLLEVRDLLSSVDLKILEMLKVESRETFMTQEIIAGSKEDHERAQMILDLASEIPFKIENYEKWEKSKTGDFQWYNISNEEGKVRKCNNSGCNLFLKFHKDKKTYEHWKMDANTGKAFFVAEKCEGSWGG